MRRFFVFLLPLTLIAACGNGGDGRDQSLATRTVVPGLAADSSATAAPGPGVQLLKVASGFRRPTYVTHAGDGSGRLFVVEKAGTIRVVQDGTIAAEPFLDITPLVGSSGNEQGLLGLAFHPEFEENGRFFVTYTAASGGANTLAEYRAPGDLGRGDPASGKVLVAIADTRANHNGGMVAFGPDGYLYFGTGDGGGGGDPDKNGQNRDALLGKILRLDVDGGAPYGIPRDNPFAGTAGAKPEVWAFGLRNPWRFSFDRETGDLWIADVGQNAWEEVDLQPAASKGGENYGWNVLEGDHCFQPSSGCNRDGKTAPAHEYSHSTGGCSVTGGYVYRGKALPALVGAYLFTDYCQDTLQVLRRTGSTFTAETVGETAGGISSFGEDEAGEVYALGDRDGTLYRVAGK